MKNTKKLEIILKNSQIKPAFEDRVMKRLARFEKNAASKVKR